MLQSQISQENNFLGVPVASCRLLKSFFRFTTKTRRSGFTGFRYPLHYCEIASNPPATLRALTIPNAIEIYYKLF